jgi:Lrp/AsnC family transcriptional regulator, leucine-responsive regulatory protein
MFNVALPHALREVRADNFSNRQPPRFAIGRAAQLRPPTGGFGVPYHPRHMDERDLEIISALQSDARATYADVAARVGLSTSAVHERVRKLEQMGTIRGYKAVIDPEALGLFVTALISAVPLDPTQPDDLPERVAEFPEVEDCYSVAGETNYILKVRTRTTGELEDLIRRLREKAAVATRTTIALSIPFEGRPMRT